jgi:hypothetical protein
MNVSELIEKLKGMPQDAVVCNSRPTSLNTLVPVMRCGTVDVIPIYGRLTEPEYREPQDKRAPHIKELATIVIVG